MDSDPWYESVFSSSEIEELLHGWNHDRDSHPDREYVVVELVFTKDKAQEFVDSALSRFYLPQVRKDLLTFAQQVAAIVRTKL